MGCDKESTRAKRRSKAVLLSPFQTRKPHACATVFSPLLLLPRFRSLFVHVLLSVPLRAIGASAPLPFSDKTNPYWARSQSKPRRPKLSLVPPPKNASLLHKLLVPAAQEPPHVAPHLGPCDPPPRLRHEGVLPRQHLPDDPPGVAPLVHQLVQHARVRVLRREARAQNLQPHGRDLRV